MLSACGSPSDPLDTAQDRSEGAGIRCEALDELAEFQGDAEAVDAIHAAFSDPDPRIVRCAAAALARLSSPMAADLLNPLLADPSPLVVAAAAEALSDTGDARSVRLLEKTAIQGVSRDGADKRWSTARRQAVLALGALRDRDAEAIMVRMLRNEPRNAEAAGSALVSLFRDDVGHLLPLLGDPRNAALVYPLVDAKLAGADAALIALLSRSEDAGLAEYYVNHGDRRLRRAAYRWADAHGYWFGAGPAHAR